MAVNITDADHEEDHARQQNVRMRNRRIGIAGSADPLLHEHERDSEDQRHDREHDDGRRSPRVVVARPRGEEHEARDRRREQRTAHPVDAHETAPHARGQRDAGDDERHDADGHVHEEDPAPRELSVMKPPTSGPITLAEPNTAPK